MKYDLKTMVQRGKKTRRKSITFRPIIAPATFASDLYTKGYAPVISAWEQSIPAIMAEYERALSSLTSDSPEQIGVRIDEIERDVSAVFFRIRLALGAWSAHVEAWQRGKWRGAILTATGIDVGTLIGAGDMRGPVSASIERNVGLVKSVSDQTRQRISQHVFDGLRKRTPAREVAASIREATGMGKRRSLNIASDQLTKLSSELAAERRREAGLSAWEWKSSHKVNYRPEHQARDGKRYTDDNPPATLPGEEINCGCTEQAVLDLDGEF